MRELRRGLTGLLAIFAFTLHTLALTYAPANASAAHDPLAVICLNAGPDGAATGQPADRQTTRDCGHCVLCVAAAPPAPHTVVSAVSFTIRPAGLSRIAAYAAPRSDPLSSPALPRGPPATI